MIRWPLLNIKISHNKVKIHPDVQILGNHHKRISNVSKVYLSDQPVLGLELLSKVHGVVDESEPSGLATSEVGLESKGEDLVSGAVVHLAELLPDVSLGDGGLAWVKNIHDHLLPAQQTVQHVFSGSDGD